jgi:hypothetical protein
MVLETRSPQFKVLLTLVKKNIHPRELELILMYQRKSHLDLVSIVVTLVIDGFPISRVASSSRSCKVCNAEDTRPTSSLAEA